jgi:Flp pilus assembly protein CpaB
LRTFSAITSRRPFTLLGILLALLVIVAFVLVALNANAANGSPTVQVVVASKDLQPRVPITSADVKLAALSVPGTYPKVYFTTAADVEGMVPLVDIHGDQAITANEVAKPNQALGSQSEFLPIPSGYVAMTIPTSEQVGVADYIQPGDYIQLIATVSTSGRVATMTVFKQVHVIKVGTQAAANGGNATSLTIVVTECQAELITWFLTYASLKYTLESYKDYAPGDQPPNPQCPVASANGISLAAVKAAFPGLF